jgi:hypothetical protein
MLNPLEQWSQGESLEMGKLNHEVEVLNQIANLLGGFGIEVMRTCGGTTVSETPKELPNGAVIVTITTTASPTPGGLYSATYGTMKLNTSAATLDVESAETSLSDLLEGAQEEECYFINLPEYGLTTHDLTDPDNEASMRCLGVFTGITSSDGFPVLAGLALPYATCT